MSASPTTDSSDAATKRLLSVSQRRQNKPLIEKRRRARINDCLLQLKCLLMKDLGKETPRQSKLEKADILEMTVDYIKKISPQNKDSTEQKTTTTPRPVSPVAGSPGNPTPFVDGFSRCMEEVDTFLDHQLHLQPHVQHKLLAYCKQQLNGKVVSTETKVKDTVFDPNDADLDLKDVKCLTDVDEQSVSDSALRSNSAKRCLRKRCRQAGKVKDGDLADSLAENVTSGIRNGSDVCSRNKSAPVFSESGGSDVNSSDDDDESKSTIMTSCNVTVRDDVRSPSSTASPGSHDSMDFADDSSPDKSRRSIDVVAECSPSAAVSSTVELSTSNSSSPIAQTSQAEASNSGIKLAGPLKLICGGNVFIVVDQQQPQLPGQNVKVSLPLNYTTNYAHNFFPQALSSSFCASLSSSSSGSPSQSLFITSTGNSSASTSPAASSTLGAGPQTCNATTHLAQSQASQLFTPSPNSQVYGGQLLYGSGAVGVGAPAFPAMSYIPSLQQLHLGLPVSSAFPLVAASLGYPSDLNALGVHNSLGAPHMDYDLSDSLHKGHGLSPITGSPQPPFRSSPEVAFSTDNDVNNNQINVIRGSSPMWRPW